jgi:hypothetical protein
MRKIAITGTAGKRILHNSAATTFGELKFELQNQVTFNGFKVTELTSKVTLELDQAELPMRDLVLVLTPQKTKAGTEFSYNEMKTFVRIAREKAVRDDDQVLLKMIGNYTSLKSSDMKNLYNEVMSYLNPETTESTDLSGVFTRLDKLEDAVFGEVERFWKAVEETVAKLKL